MRKSMFAACATAALAVLAAGSVVAQQAPQRGLRADADADGRISRAEFIDARLARLTAMDANRDGSVSAEERRTAMQARRAERAVAWFDALDKDGNGAISREEFTAPREQRAERAEGAMRGERMGQHGSRHGPRGGRHAGFREGRGGEARGPVAIADVQTRLATRFDRIDANRDGYITAEERTAARQAERTERREHRMSRRGAAPASPSTPASE